MRNISRCLLALLLSALMVLLPAIQVRAQDQSTPAPVVPTTTLRGHLQEHYVELFDLAPKLHYSAVEIEKQRTALGKGKDVCVSRFKEHAKKYGKQIEETQKNLKETTTKLNDAQRKQVHCKIQNLELLKAEAAVLSGHAIPTAYDNLNAKLDIIAKWPLLYQETQQEIASESYLKRRWGNVKDIGFREIASGQQDDIKRGQQAIEEMKRAGLIPPEVENKAIQDYVNTIGQRIAKFSDLKIPLHISVLQSREINAFALPGGYLFIERGLLEAADDEAELAGVIAHEISHDVARHSNKLMKRATIASILYQAAQIAAVVLTGGVAGIGMYYAIQYGFYGLGLVISLQLLGVSRDFELEADQLGIQYAWNAGYDTTGFIRFFDKLATQEGYVNGVSWFRTHPPFYQRMVDVEREILFLQQKPAAILQTSEFEQMKKELAPVAAKAEKEEVGRPSLKITREQGCEPPKKLEYKPGEPIETLCSSPLQTLNGSKP
jgi:Zn-dependent protease with chaperone function